VVAKIASGLVGMVTGSEALDIGSMLESAPPASAPAAAKPQLSVVESTPAPGAAAAAPAAAGEYMAPWIDTDECTECDECIMINPQIFEYNADKKAIIKNPDAGPYRDLVKAAEKCTAGIIHPGLPRDHSDKDIAKWIKRGQKFN